MKIKQLTLATLAMSLVGGSIVAQQPLPSQTEVVKPRTAPDRPISAQPNQKESVRKASSKVAIEEDSQLNNQAFADCLVITNEEQVLLARFAKNMAVNDDVKAFAESMESAHQSYLDELKGISSSGSTESEAANAILRSDGNSRSSIGVVQLHQEVSEQCLKDSKEMLSTKEGIEFDKCFVGMQVAKHAMMHSSLTVFERHATGELRGLIKAGLAKNSEHMQAAVSLMEQLAASDSSKTDVSSK